MNPCFFLNVFWFFFLIIVLFSKNLQLMIWFFWFFIGSEKKIRFFLRNETESLREREKERMEEEHLISPWKKYRCRCYHLEVIQSKSDWCEKCCLLFYIMLFVILVTSHGIFWGFLTSSLRKVFWNRMVGARQPKLGDTIIQTFVPNCCSSLSYNRSTDSPKVLN